MFKVNFSKYAIAVLFIFLVTVFSVTSFLWLLKYGDAMSITPEQIGIDPVAFAYSFLIRAIVFAILYVLVMAAVRFLGASKESTYYLAESLKPASMIFLLGIFLNLLHYSIFSSYSIVSVVFVPLFALAYVGSEVIKQQGKGTNVLFHATLIRSSVALRTDLLRI